MFARSFWLRGTGLIFKKFIPGKMDALVFERCSSLHTFFLKYKFDIIFVDKSKKVIKLYKDASPWQTFFSGSRLFEYCCAVECPSGTIENSNTNIGDMLNF